MSKWIDADKRITAQLYDDEHEEWSEENMTIAEYLDRYTEEGCPSVDRPQGEWKDRTYGGRILHPWWESCECSQCEEWGSGAWNFCPHCGARMKGADDEM